MGAFKYFRGLSYFTSYFLSVGFGSFTSNCCDRVDTWEFHWVVKPANSQTSTDFYYVLFHLTTSVIELTKQIWLSHIHSQWKSLNSVLIAFSIQMASDYMG